MREDFSAARAGAATSERAFVDCTESIALDLTDRIYRAASQREEWTGFCSALGVALGGAAVAINLEHPRPGEKGLAYSTGFDPAYRASFRTHYFAIEPWEEATSRLPVGALAFGAHLVPDEVILHSEYYNDWMKPQGFAVGPTLGAVIGIHGEARSYLGVYRPKGAREYGSREYALCRLLMPPLRRAIEFDRRFRSLTAEREIAFDAMDYLSVGLIVVDRQGKIHACNRIAEEIAALKDGLCIDEYGLAAAVVPETRKLRILIHQAACCKGHRGGSLSLTRPSGKPDLDVFVTCFSGASLEGQEGRRVAAVLIKNTTRSNASGL
jgi:PAS domain-containing protein